MNGILLVDKPVGPTSAEVVRRVKRQFRCKTGHLGTLDPFASGLLPICLGEGTKVAQFIAVADKGYEGTIQLGNATDSGDPTGTVTETRPPLGPIAAERLREVAASFLGAQLQTPPMHSALKRNGRPLYELARAGVVVEREPRPIEIASFELHSATDDTLSFRVDCTKGTYVRVLAADVAAALGTVGHLAALRRTRFGDFDVNSAISLEAVEHGDEVTTLIDLRGSLAGLREFEIPAIRAPRVRQGDQGVLAGLPVGEAGENAKLISAGEENLVAVISWTADRAWRYARVFV